MLRTMRYISRFDKAARTITLGTAIMGLTSFAVAQTLPVPPVGMQAPGITVPTQNVTPNAPAPMPALEPMPDVTGTPYVLAPSDQLEIFVQGHEDLHQTVEVLNDGTFQYPIVGKVQAAGKTIDAVEASLTQALSVECKDPQVTVLVRESHSRKISVAGAVKSPGLYEYHPGLRLLELIAACGGPLEATELTQATLITDGGTKSVPVDLTKLMNDNDTSLNVALAPGDMLLLTPRDPALSMVQLVGQVGKPGQYDVMTGGATIVTLLTEAGGELPDAALTKAQLMHAGTVTDINLHPLKYDLDDPTGKIKLVPGDTLLIPENKRKIAVLGAVRSPNVYLIPDGEDLPITQAIAQAGGVGDDGDKKQVGILRIGADKQRHLIQVNMDKLLKGDAQVADADLQPGDILVVPTRNQKKSLGDYINQVPGLYYVSRIFTGGL